MLSTAPLLAGAYASQSTPRHATALRPPSRAAAVRRGCARPGAPARPALNTRYLSQPHSSSVQARCSLPPAPQLVYTLAAAPRTPPAPPAPPFALAFVAVSLSGTLAACLLAAIPTLLSLKRAADELAALAATIRAEVPDTAAAVRLSGLELSDAFEEVSGLTSDLSGGLRSSARALSAAEAGVRAVGAAVRTRALPAVVRLVVPVAREAAARSQDMLAERAGMDDYSGPALAAAAQGTSASVSKLRTALQAAGVAKRLGRAIAFVRATVRSDAPKQ